MGKVLRDLALLTFTMPTLASGADQIMQFLWQGEATGMRKRIAQLAKNKQKSYALVIGQCLPKLLNTIKGTSAYAAVEAVQDTIQLLLIIRGYCCRFDNHPQSTWALEQAKH